MATPPQTTEQRLAALEAELNDAKKEAKKLEEKYKTEIAELQKGTVPASELTISLETDGRLTHLKQRTTCLRQCGAAYVLRAFQTVSHR